MFCLLWNICRSPMAEYILKQRLRKLGREKDFIVESRAISNEEIGKNIYPRILLGNNWVVAALYCNDL